MLHRRQCTLLGTRRHFVSSESSGPPLLFLHGVTRRCDCFHPILPAFVPGWKVFALDFRGHGKSDHVPDGYRVIDYVADAVEFIRTTIREPTVIHGHSLGSMVAAATAGEIPDLVTAVILEDPPFETMGNQIGKTALLDYFTQLKRWASCGKTVPEIAAELAEIRMQTPGDSRGVRLGDIRDAAWFRFAAKSLLSLDPAVLDPIARSGWLEDYNWREIMTRIACPALLLEAELSAGGMLTPDAAAEAARLIPDCTRIKFDCHHLIHWYATRELVNAVLNFLV
jgi:pimeloyl-ACP methyl ester carboxylesterase